MKIEIYRKRSICGLFDVEDDKPVSVFCNVSEIQNSISNISALIDGERIVIKKDNFNYNYHILEEA